MQGRHLPRRVVAGAAAFSAVATLLAGCGSDHGQANALQACHTFASAMGGGLTPQQFQSKLQDAAHWASKASKQNATWSALQSSLTQFAQAPTAAAEGSSALRDARTVIDGQCEVASRGY